MRIKEMRVETLFDILDSDFYTGVPDSQLQALCNFLIDKYGISEPVSYTHLTLPTKLEV